MKSLFKTTLTPKELKLSIIFTIIQVTHALDFVVLMPLGPILMRKLNLSPSEFSSLVSSYNISAGVVSIFFGNLIDYVERKKFLILTYLGFIFATLLCALSADYKTLLMARILAGACGGLATSSIFSFIGDQVRKNKQGEATGIVLSSFGITTVVGVPIGLHLATTYYWEVTFMMIVALSLVVLLFSIWKVPTVHVSLEGKLSWFQTMKQYKKILNGPNELLAIFLVFLVSFASFLIIPFIAPVMVKNFGLSENYLKYTYLFGGIFSLITSRLVGVWCDRFGHLKVYIVFAFLSFIPTILITHVHDIGIYLIFIISTLMMMIFNSRFIPVMSMLNTIPNPEHRGLFMSLSQAVRTFSVAFGAWVAGKLVSVDLSNGKITGFVFNGWLSITIIIISIILSLKLKKQLGKRTNNI